MLRLLGLYGFPRVSGAGLGGLGLSGRRVCGSIRDPSQNLTP